MRTKTCVAERLADTWASVYLYENVKYIGLLTHRKGRWSFVSNHVELNGLGVKEPGYTYAWDLGSWTSLASLLLNKPLVKLL